MNEPLISIIIPVYNVERYLPKCLDSVIHQSYKNIEIICVNDGSPDNSSEILAEYEKKDPRIKVINQKNTGLAGARNTGVDAAIGDYIMFVDSDDWIDLNSCEVAIKYALQYTADAILFPYVKEYMGKSEKKEIFEEKLIVFNGTEVKSKLHRRIFGLVDHELRHPEKADSIVTVWGKLYTSSVIKDTNCKFIDLSIIGTEDALFNIGVIDKVGKAVYTSECFYHYRKNNTTSLTKSYKKDLINQWNRLFGMMETYIEENNLPNTYKTALSNRISFSVIGLGLNEILSNKNTIAKLKGIKQIIENERYRDAIAKLKIEFLPIHWKVFFAFSKYRFSIGVYSLLKVISLKVIG